VKIKVLVLLVVAGFFGLLAPARAQSLASLSPSDRASIESACNYSKVIEGAAAYHTCLNNQLEELGQVGTSATARRRTAAAPGTTASATLPVAPPVAQTFTTPPVASTTAPGATSTAVAPATTIGQCAENGSCYGDISPATGLPKTVAVRGYYRADGTYVRGYYRSK
jgi:hypothetical protein